MRENPWSELTVPSDKNAISARRVNEQTRWDFYWGCDSERNCLLVLRHEVVSGPRNRLPRLKGVDVFVQQGEENVKPSLVLRLLDGALRDIFYQLCSDVVASTAECRSESEAVATTVARTWRWHHMLRGGGSGLLSVEEQKGLMGELIVLERYMLPSFSVTDCLTAWLGPLGSPQDFVLGATGIESKSRSSRGSGEVQISSEHQLDNSALQSLFLHVSVFDSAEHADDAFTVSDVARRIRSRFAAGDTFIAERYDALLTAAGFRYEDDYSDFPWKGGGGSIYEVRQNFPALTPGNIPKETRGVKYMLSMGDCSQFLVAPADLVQALHKGNA
jgi:hypothetical protein